MNMDINIIIWLVPGIGMMLIASMAVVYWRRLSRLPFKWFWVGAGLWTVAVILKIVCAILINPAVIGFMEEALPYPLLVIGGGLFIGIQSSLFEIGLILLAVLVWRQLGKDAEISIGIGIGAGAFEAFLLGLLSLVGILAFFAGVPGTEEVPERLGAAAAITPVFWLAPPVERIIAILCHASSRALVLLGITHRKPMMVFWGFLIFTLLDGVAGGFLVAGKVGYISLWWIYLALLPFALVSIPILRWCYARWGTRENDTTKSETNGI